MSGQAPPPRMATEKLSQAAIGAASSALVAHSGGGMPPLGGGRPGAAQEVDLEDLFSLKKPKNVLSGATSGLQSVAKGGQAPRLGAGTLKVQPRCFPAAVERRRGCRRPCAGAGAGARLGTWRLCGTYRLASRRQWAPTPSPGSVAALLCGLRPSSRLTRVPLFSPGVLGGATALIAAPALGAREEGAVGFLKGLGAGASAAPRPVLPARWGQRPCAGWLTRYAGHAQA